MTTPITSKTGANDRNNWRLALRVSAVAIVPAVAARVLVLAVLCSGPVTFPQILHQHDGHEYLEFAHAIATGTLADLPRDARRHEPGWPMLMAPFTRLPFTEIAATVLIWVLLGGSIILFARILLRHTDFPTHAVSAILLAFGLAYPAHLYYHSFALGEALFTFCVLAASGAFLSHRLPLAFALAGIAALVRTPGIFLALSFAYLLITQREYRALVFAPLAIIPQFAWNAFYYYMWRETPTQLLSPKLAFPLASYIHVFDLGLARGVYQLCIAAFFCATIGRLLYQVRHNVWPEPVTDLAMCFVSLFFVFHACIYSMQYLGSPVYACQYMDRYMVGALPFVALAWREFLSRRVIAFAAIVSIALSVYWGRNYLVAVGLT